MPDALILARDAAHRHPAGSGAVDDMVPGLRHRLQSKTVYALTTGLLRSLAFPLLGRPFPVLHFRQIFAMLAHVLMVSGDFLLQRVKNGVGVAL